mgnify:FL=1|jgi:hypothetical protein
MIHAEYRRSGLCGTSGLAVVEFMRGANLLPGEETISMAAAAAGAADAPHR